MTKSLSEEEISVFISGWETVNSFVEFEVFDVNAQKQVVRDRVGYNVGGLSCKSFVNFFDNNISCVIPSCNVEPDNFPLLENSMGSCCNKDVINDVFVYDVDSAVLWLDYSDENILNTFETGMKNRAEYSVSVFSEWIREYFNGLDNNFSENENIRFLFENLKHFSGKKIFGVYEHNLAMISNTAFDFVDNFNTRYSANIDLGTDLTFTDKELFDFNIVNTFQRLSSNPRASVSLGTYTPIGFLLSVFGVNLVNVFEFLFEYYDFSRKLIEYDLIIIFEKDLHLLNIDSSLLFYLRRYFVKLSIPVVLVCENLELSRVELNDYFVTSSYLLKCDTDFDEMESLRNLGIRLGNTWRL